MVVNAEGLVIHARKTSVKDQHKVPTTLRLDEDVLQRWRDSGKSWQTRAAELLAAHAPAAASKHAGF